MLHFTLTITYKLLSCIHCLNLCTCMLTLKPSSLTSCLLEKVSLLLECLLSLFLLLQFFPLFFLFILNFLLKLFAGRLLLNLGKSKCQSLISTKMYSCKTTVKPDESSAYNHSTCSYIVANAYKSNTKFTFCICVLHLSFTYFFLASKIIIFLTINYVIDVIQTYCLCMSLNPGPLTCKSSTLLN